MDAAPSRQHFTAHFAHTDLSRAEVLRTAKTCGSVGSFLPFHWPRLFLLSALKVLCPAIAIPAAVEQLRLVSNIFAAPACSSKKMTKRSDHFHMKTSRDLSRPNSFADHFQK